jgi:iron complex transport system substrate-binding protein
MKKIYLDQIGISHSFESSPKRIVSLVPSQTELLYEMGLEDLIVGITNFCVHPYHFKSTKKIVGGTKKVHFDKISALNPDIIIANKEENTQEIVDKLSQICPVWVTNIVTINDSLQMIADFGQIFNKRTEAQKWIDKINFGLDSFKLYVKDKPALKVAYFIWRNPYMVAGGSTFINELLKLNNFENVYESSGRYPEIAIEEIRFIEDLDIVFLSSEPYPFKDEHAFEIGRFTHHAKTIFIDGEMFSWHGSRLLKSFEYFKLLHQKLNSNNSK